MSCCLRLRPNGHAPGGPGLNPPGKIWIGDGETSVGTYNGKTEAPFAAALVAYGGNLREIEVLPGTYTFGATVNVARPGVRLYGSRRCSSPARRARASCSRSMEPGSPSV